jgi:hypothetical protein
VQEIEIPFAPMGGGKAKPGNEGEQCDEYDERSPVHFVHGVSPRLFLASDQSRYAREAVAK